MKRPKKKTITNPTLPADQQADERHLIDSGESAAISIEDRIHLYWMENKGFITGCIALLALLVIGFNGMRIYAGYAERKVQAAYTAARASDSLADFARAHRNKPLGGVAALQVADNAYAAAEYATAETFYSIAAKAFTNDLLLGRARIGQAFAKFYQDDPEQGLAQLRAIAADNMLPAAIRAEAAYHLAIEADVAEDNAGFESYASQVNSSASAGQWQERMQLYQQQR